MAKAKESKPQMPGERNMKKIAREFPSDDSIEYTYANGEKFVAKLSDLPAEIVTLLARRGLNEKLTDATAGLEAEHCPAAQSAVYKSLVEGKWNRVGDGSSTKTPKVSQLAAALARVKGKPVEECVAVLASLGETEEGKATLTQIRNHPDIKKAVAEIKLEKAQAEAAKAAEEGGEAVEGADVLASL